MEQPTSSPFNADAPPRPGLLLLANEADSPEVIGCDVSKEQSELIGEGPNLIHD